MNKKITPYILLFLTALLLFSCKSAKLSDAEEKQRIGEYLRRRLFTGKCIRKRLRRNGIYAGISPTGWLNVTGLSITLRGQPVLI